MTDDQPDVSVGDRVQAEQAVGGGFSKVIHGTVTDVVDESPLPHYDGAEVHVDVDGDGEVVPVRAARVERADGGEGGDAA